MRFSTLLVQPSDVGHLAILTDGVRVYVWGVISGSK
jgi:hypothetical protein